MSASSVGDVTSLTDGKSAQSTTGTTQVVSLNGGVSTMSSSGATTCYKKKTCEEGRYSTSIPDGKKCDTVNYNGYTCYTNCKDNNYDFKVFLVIQIAKIITMISKYLPQAHQILVPLLV